MPSYNLMQDESIIEEGGGSLIRIILSNLVMSLLTVGIYPYLIASNTGVAVTDQRVIIKHGKLFGSNTHEVRLDNVQGVSSNGSELSVSNAAGETYKLKLGNTGEIRTAINQAQQG